MAYSAQANAIERMIKSYARLQEHIETFRDYLILPFDERAAREFERLRQARVRIGTMHLKIASIALANDATVLTCNLIDFSKVPNLRCEDWSA